MEESCLVEEAEAEAEEIQVINLKKTVSTL